MKKNKIHPLTAKIIRMIMVYKNISSRKLAKELGITHTYLSMLIHGKKRGGEYRQKILEKLQLPPSFWNNPLQVDFNLLLKSNQDTNYKNEEI